MFIQCSHELPARRHPPMHVQCKGGEVARDIECDEQQPNVWNGQHHRLCWRLRQHDGKSSNGWSYSTQCHCGERQIVCIMMLLAVLAHKSGVRQQTMPAAMFFPVGQRGEPSHLISSAVEFPSPARQPHPTYYLAPCICENVSFFRFTHVVGSCAGAGALGCKLRRNADRSSSRN